MVLQVPLYAYALTKIYKGIDVSRVEYRALSDTRPGAMPGKAYPHCLQLLTVDRKTGNLNRDTVAADEMDRALGKVA